MNCLKYFIKYILVVFSILSPLDKALAVQDKDLLNLFDKYIAVPINKKNSQLLSQSLQNKINEIWQSEVITVHKHNLWLDFTNKLLDRNITEWKPILHKLLCKINSLQQNTLENCDMQFIETHKQEYSWMNSFEQIQREDQILYPGSFIVVAKNSSYNWLLRKGNQLKMVYSSLEDLPTQANLLMNSNQLTTNSALEIKNTQSNYKNEYKSKAVQGVLVIATAGIIYNFMKDKTVLISYDF